MIAIDLKAFLKTGELGPIRLGMTRQEVVDILGKPSMWGSHNQWEKAGFWLYGCIELYFPEPRDSGDDVLYQIFSDHFPLEGDDTHSLDPWILSEQLTLAEAEAALTREQIPYIRTEEVPTIHLIHFILPSGVNLNFYPDEETGEHRLTGFSAQFPQTRHEPIQQISVTLPLPAYEKLRRRVGRKNISRWCSEWLAAHIARMPDEGLDREE